MLAKNLIFNFNTAFESTICCSAELSRISRRIIKPGSSDNYGKQLNCHFLPFPLCILTYCKSIFAFKTWSQFKKCDQKLIVSFYFYTDLNLQENIMCKLYRLTINL